MFLSYFFVSVLQVNYCFSCFRAFVDYLAYFDAEAECLEFGQTQFLVVVELFVAEFTLDELKHAATVHDKVRESVMNCGVESE